MTNKQKAIIVGIAYGFIGAGIADCVRGDYMGAAGNVAGGITILGLRYIEFRRNAILVTQSDITVGSSPPQRRVRERLVTGPGTRSVDFRPKFRT